MINIKNDKAIKAFGEKIRSLRTFKSLSQEELANLAEIPLSQVGRIERGEVNPTLSTITAIATALNLEVKELF